MATLDFNILAKDLASGSIGKIAAAFEGLNLKLDKMAAKSVNILVRVDDKGAVTKLAATDAAVSGIDAKAGKAAGTGGGMALLGKSVAGIAVVIAGTVGASIDMALKFDDATHRMAASAGIPVEAAQKIGAAFLTTGGQTTFSAQKMADAFGPVAAKLGEMQGHALDANQALGFMRAAMAAAEATGGDLNDTTNSLAKVMVAFGLGVDGASKAADILTNASHLTNIPIADLADGMDKLHAKLGIAAPDLGGMSTLLVDLGNHGITGTKGLNLLNSATSTLLGSSKTTKKEIEDLGLKVVDNTGHFVGYGSIIEQLNPKFAKMTDAQKRQAEVALFGSSAQGTMNAIIGDGIGKYNELSGSVTKVGSAQEGADKATDTFHGHLEKLRAALADAAVTIGQHFLPFLSKILDVITPVVASIASKFIPALQSVGGAISTMVKQFGVIDTIKGIFNDLVGIIKAVWPVVQRFAQGFAQVFGAELIGGIKLAKIALDGIFAAVKALADFLGPMAKVIGGVVAAFLAFRLVNSVVTLAIGGITNLLSNFGASLSNLPGKLGDVGSKAEGALSKIGSFATKLTGPLTIGLVGAAALLAVLAKRHEDAAAAAEAQAGRVNTLSEALKASNGAIDGNVRASAAQALANFKVSDGTRNLLGDVEKLVGPSGIPLLTDAYLGNKQSLDTLKGSLTNVETAHTHAGTAVELLTTKFDHMKFTGAGTVGVLDDTGFAAKQLKDILDQSGGTFQAAVDKLRQMGVAAADNKPQMGELAIKLATMGSSASTADEKVSALSGALNILLGRSVDATAAEDTFKKALIDLTDRVSQNGNALNGDSKEALDNRDAVRQAIRASEDHAQALFKQTGNVNDAKDALNRDAQALYDNMIKTGMNKDEVMRMLTQLGFIPGKAGDALGGMQRFADGTNSSIQRIGDKVIHVSASGSWVEGPGGISTSKQFGPRARGGPIWGAGTGTSDSIHGWLSHGEYVINAASTRKHYQLVEAINQDTLPKFARGGHVGNLTLESHTDGGNLMSGLQGWLKASIDGFAKRIGDAMTAAMNAAGTPGNYSPSGGVQRWAGLVIQALGMVGQPIMALQSTLRRMQQESGGNPNAINLTDSNARAGHPSIGLMQVIGPTFNAYRDFRAANNIYDPLANILASMHYAIARYGSLSAAYNRAGGYANGALISGPTLAKLGESGPEMVLPLTRPRRMDHLLNQAAGVRRGANSNPTEVIFKGNVDSALATAIMKLIRNNVIQIKQSNVMAG